MAGEMAPPPHAVQIRVLGAPFIVESVSSLIRATPELEVLSESKPIPNRRDDGVRRYLVVRFRSWASEHLHRPMDPGEMLI